MKLRFCAECKGYRETRAELVPKTYFYRGIRMVMTENHNRCVSCGTNCPGNGWDQRDSRIHASIKKIQRLMLAQEAADAARP